MERVDRTASQGFVCGNGGRLGGVDGSGGRQVGIDGTRGLNGVSNLHTRGDRRGVGEGCWGFIPGLGGLALGCSG